VPADPRYQFLLATPQEKTQSGEPYNSVLLAKAVQFDPIIEKAAVAASVEADLLRAVIVVESGFNARAKSRRGAVGLMQLMPETARRFGATNRYDPKQNVHAGARYLKSLIDRYGKDIKLALAAYNAGEDAVDRCGRCIPAYKETQAYVPKVLRVYQNAPRPDRSDLIYSETLPTSTAQAGLYPRANRYSLPVAAVEFVRYGRREPTAEQWPSPNQRVKRAVVRD